MPLARVPTVRFFKRIFSALENVTKQPYSFLGKTLAATGSVQGDAAALVARCTSVSGGDSIKGVILPATPNAQQVYIVYNPSRTGSVFLYPGSGDTINNHSVNSGAAIPPRQLAFCIAASNSAWAVAIR